MKFTPGWHLRAGSNSIISAGSQLHQAASAALHEQRSYDVRITPSGTGPIRYDHQPGDPPGAGGVRRYLVRPLQDAGAGVGRVGRGLWRSGGFLYRRCGSGAPTGDEPRRDERTDRDSLQKG